MKYTNYNDCLNRTIIWSQGIRIFKEGNPEAELWTQNLECNYFKEKHYKNIK